MIGNNACGSRALGYGRTSDNVAALDVITGTGERLALTGSATPDSSPTLTALRDVVAGNLATIRTEFGRFGRQVSGYSLEHLLPERGFDVTRAFVGTEGTLGGRARRHGPAGPYAAGHGARRARLRRHGDRGRRRTGAAAVRADRGRGPRPADRRRRGGQPWTGGGAGVAARQRMAVRRAGRRRPARRSARSPTGSSPPRARWTRGWSPTRRRPRRCGGSGRMAPVSRPGRWAASAPTPAGRTPRCRPTSSAPTCASSRR